MPDTIPAADLSSMDATIAALDAALASGESVPGAGSLADDSNLNDFNAAPALPAVPAEPAAPAAPAEPVPSPAAGDEEPAPPVLHPSAKSTLPDGMPRNFRLAAQDEAEALAFQIRKSNPNMHMRDALAQAEHQLGIQQPAPSATPSSAESPAPSAPADPVAELDARLKELRDERKGLNPALDAESFTAITEQIEDLNSQRSEARARAQYEAAQQRQADIATEMASAEDQFNQVAGVFADLQDDSSEFAQRFAALHNANVSSNSPLLETADYETALARQVAGEFLMLGKPFQVRNGAATTPAVPPMNTPPGTPPAAPAPATAGTAPAPAAMAPLPGNPAPTSAHRVIVQSADPLVAAQQQIASAAAAGDTASVLEALNASLGGQAPRTGLAFHSID